LALAEIAGYERLTVGEAPPRRWREADAVDGRVDQAVALDPLTGALLTLEQVRAMTDELFTAHAALLEPHGW
jgi:hypothetical protein